MPRDESRSLVDASRALIRRISQHVLSSSRQRVMRADDRLTTSIGLQLESTQRLRDYQDASFDVLPSARAQLQPSFPTRDDRPQGDSAAEEA